MADQEWASAVRSTHLPPHVCPYCGSKHDASASMEGATPRDDGSSVTVCVDCGEVSKFVKGFQLERLDDWRDSLPEEMRTQIRLFQAFLKHRREA